MSKQSGSRRWEPPLVILGAQWRRRVSSLYSSPQAWTNVAFRSTIILVWGPDPSWLAFSSVSYECESISPGREREEGRGGRGGRREEVTPGTAVAAARKPCGCCHWNKLKFELPSSCRLVDCAFLKPGSRVKRWKTAFRLNADLLFLFGRSTEAVSVIFTGSPTSTQRRLYRAFFESGSENACVD